MMLLFQKWTQGIIKTLLQTLESIGAGVIFLLSMFWLIFQTKNLKKLVYEQIVSIGVWPFVVTACSGMCMGSVLFLQAHRILSPFRLESQLPTVVVLPLLREFGPVLSAWLLAGVIGSALTAETGLMKSTEQLLSLELMGIDPLGRVFLPRLLALLFLLPIMTAIFIVVAIFTSAQIGAIFFNFEISRFWATCSQEIHWTKEIIATFFKTLIFSKLTALISLFVGFRAVPNSEGVSQATTRAVTLSLLSILFFDLLFTACTEHLA